MFETGDYVVYGHTGICRVLGTTTMDMDGVPKDRLYYVLRPDGETEGKIFTPVENCKVQIRKTMSMEEVEELLESITEIETLDIENDKMLEEKYKECLTSCECKEMIRILKAIYLRKKDRISKGKKVTATDERYLKMAEESVYSELSMLLGIPKGKMEGYISSRIRGRK